MTLDLVLIGRKNLLNVKKTGPVILDILKGRSLCLAVDVLITIMMSTLINLVATKQRGAGGVERQAPLYSVE